VRLPAREAFAQELLIEHPVVDPHVSQAAVKLVGAFAIEGEPHAAAGDKLLGERRCFRPPRLDRMLGLDGLGRVDADQADADVRLEQEGVAVDDAPHGVRAGL